MGEGRPAEAADGDFSVPDPAAMRVVTWLLTVGVRHGDIPALIEAYAHHLREAGCPIERMTLHVRLLHPQIRAVTYIWRVDRDGIEQINREHGIELTPDYRQSPISAIIDGGVEGIHVPLERTAPPYPYPVLHDLWDQGFRDYTAMALVGANGRRNAVTFATRHPGGFSAADLGMLYGALPALSVLLEARALRLLATTLLNTYVGPAAGQRILDGDIRRGSGMTLSAVLWYCDLRGFTPLADRLEIGALIALLNGYFEIMGGAVQRRGGEVLKFVGDALLAIFPIGAGNGPDELARQCAEALAAADEAMAGMTSLNAQRAAWGQPLLGAGIALHVGDVLYGNIGAPDRLDFTVIGPAVNLVTRLEGLTRALDRPLLTSAAFAAACPEGGLRSLGLHAVKGLQDPVEVFGRD